MVSQLIGTLKKCYNGWEIVHTAEKAAEGQDTSRYPSTEPREMFRTGLRYVLKHPIRVVAAVAAPSS